MEPDTRLYLPIAHGEGNYFHPEGAAGSAGYVPLTYEHNPNGAQADTAALLDRSGQVLGIMPHPERAADAALGSTDGLQLFRAAKRWLRRGPDAGAGGRP